MSPTRKRKMTSSLPSAPLQSSSEPLEPRDWAGLPRELTVKILSMLGSMQILLSARKVCRAWRSVCTDPSMWRSIDMGNFGGFPGNDLEALCLHAVNLSQGGLEDLTIWCFIIDPLLRNIAVRSRNLRRLRLVRCYGILDEGLKEAFAKLPVLDHLDISLCSVSEEVLKAVGCFCPLLHTLKFNNNEGRPPIKRDVDAFAIAQSMPALRWLELVRNTLTDNGLSAILDGCPHLEYLDLRRCYNINLVGNLKKQCSERIKVLRQPNDSTPLQL